MKTKFLIFCEIKTGDGSVVHYLNDVICNPEDLQHHFKLLDTLDVKVFKVLPLFVDEKNGSVVFNPDLK